MLHVTERLFRVVCRKVYGVRPCNPVFCFGSVFVVQIILARLVEILAASLDFETLAFARSVAVMSGCGN
jgi:hypothetical protein